MAQDVFLLNVIGNVSNQYVENVLAFQSDISNSAFPAADAKQLADAFAAQILTPEWLACCSDDYECAGIRCRRVNNTGGPSVAVLTPASTGTFGTLSVVSGQGGVLLWPYHYTPGVKRKWSQGRTFIPGLPDTAIVNNELSFPFVAAMQALATALGTPLVAGGRTFQFGIWSREAQGFFSIAHTNVSYNVATQRRRYKPAI
jgi:hypothetical protein